MTLVFRPAMPQLAGIALVLSLTWLASVEAQGAAEAAVAQAKPAAPAQAKPTAPATAKPGADKPATPQTKPAVPQAKPPATTPAVPAPPPGYIIGPEDVLTIMFWREKDLSGEFFVRPDGKITLPLLNDIEAAGLSTEQLRVRLTEAADKFITEPNVTVGVKQINSLKVFITGQINKPGVYPIIAPINVAQLITMAGGLLEYADQKNIVILRTEAGKQVSRKFNYDDIKRGRNLQQNIELRPGDTVMVP